MNNTQSFYLNGFGTVRAVFVDGKPYFYSATLGRCLNRDLANSVLRYVPEENRIKVSDPTINSKFEVHALDVDGVRILLRSIRSYEAPRLLVSMEKNVFPQLGIKPALPEEPTVQPTLNLPANVKNLLVDPSKIQIRFTGDKAQIRERPLELKRVILEIGYAEDL